MNKIFTEIYDMSLPYLKRGEKISPVIHTDYVFRFAKELGYTEKLNKQDNKILGISAILHDIGNCRCNLKKIVESDVLRDPSLKQSAIDCRLEHMSHGVVLSNEILYNFRTKNTESLNKYEHQEIIRLVGNHDNYKIVKYGYEAPVYNDKLMRLLNEADVLWMLTREGIETDIKRGSNFTIKEQVKHNLKTIGNKVKTKQGKEILDNLLRRLI